MNPPGSPEQATPAQRLLLACLSMDPKTIKQAAPGGISEAGWQQIRTSAESNGITPLLYYSISQLDPTLHPPPAIVQTLRTSFRLGLMENMDLISKVSQHINCLAQAGIPVILLKGIYLASQVYPNPGLRAMGDVDLLVPREQLAAAFTNLRSQGFQAPYAFDIDRECRSMHHLPGMSHPNGLVIELHWTLVPPGAPYKLPIDEIWDSSTPIGLLEAPCRAMAVEDLLSHLSLHTAYLETFSSGLRPLCDIAWLLRLNHDRVDWAALINRADQWGIRRCLWLALYLTKELLNGSVTIEELDLLQPDDIDPQLPAWAADQVLHPTDLGGKLAAVWAPNPWHRRSVLFIYELFPPIHEMRPAYPALAHGLLWPLAYGWHLWIVLKRNWKTAWLLLRHDRETEQQAQQRENINKLVNWLGGR